jgi:hypothetical protein
VRVLGEEPGPGLPNQHTKACPRFQTMHCWCPPATGPGQPHQSDSSHYSRPVPFVSTLDKKYVDPKLPMKGPFFGHGIYTAYPGEHVVLSGVKYPGKLSEAKLSVMQAQAYNHALQWLDKQNPAPLAPGCTCAAKSGVIGHAGFCPLSSAGEKV